METARRRELVLENLDCADCAARIEAQVGKLDGVSRASLDFVLKRLTLDLRPGSSPVDVMARTNRIIHDIEPGVVVQDLGRLAATGDSDDGDDAFSRARIVRLAVAVAFYAAALAFAAALPPALGITLYLAAYLLVGADVLIAAGRNILHGRVFDENFLMAVATLGAFAIRAYPEAVAVMLFYQAGEFFEKLAIGHSRRSIDALMDIRPDSANVRRGDVLVKVPPDEVLVGERISVRPGERVPLDGRVREGVSTLDASALTGESLPRGVRPGDEVFAGTINLNGLLEIETTKAFGESTVSRVLDLVQHASACKAPTETFIAKFARVYTPAVVGIAASLAVLPPLLVPGATFSAWIYRALVFLVVSCPCALVISIPLGYFGGIGAASRHGILVKGGNYLEALNRVDTVVFDKTGTLTKGVFEVILVERAASFDGDLLELAALAEHHSNHPIAASIGRAYGKAVDARRIGGHEEIPGQGVRTRVDDVPVLAGNADYLRRAGVVFDEATEPGTVVYLAKDGHYAGHLVIADEIKEDAALAMRRLREAGVRRLVMLTGDSRAVGEKVGRELGFDEIHAELLPDRKVEAIEALERSSGRRGSLVFVGDGINDAPVLARADVGIAMGGLGSDAAIEAADVVLMTDEPSKVAEAVRLARRTRRIVWQNIVLALGIKAVVLLLGAAGLATMWEAVFADMGVAMIAIFNAMRVLNDRKG